MSNRYNPKDRFYQKAKKESFVARSAFKLEELDRRFQLIKKGSVIVDLGCSPGSWIQYLAKAVGPKGVVVGYDIEPVRVSGGPRIQTHVVDVHALQPEEIRAHIAALTGEDRAPEVDAVLSDMAPKLSGIRDTDQARSIGLVEKALFLAEALVGPEGAFVAKVFHGRGTDELLAATRKVFSEVRLLRPEATREGSREGFIVAKGRRTVSEG